MRPKQRDQLTPEQQQIVVKNMPLVRLMTDFLPKAEDWMFGPSVEARNALQRSGAVHPYTCGNDRMDEAHRKYAAEHGGDFGQLVAVEGGWVCPVCGYTQEGAKP